MELTDTNNNYVYDGEMHVSKSVYHFLMYAGKKRDIIYVGISNYQNNNSEPHLSDCYIFVNGRCVGVDHVSVGAATKGFLTNSYVTYREEYDHFIVSGAKVEQAAHIVMDNISEPASHNGKEYQLNTRMSKEIVKEASFYLYLARQITAAHPHPCYDRMADIVDGAAAFDEFSKTYIRPYELTHSLTGDTFTNDAQVRFVIDVDAAGRGSVNVVSLQPWPEAAAQLMKDTAAIAKYRKVLTDIINQNINKLHFTPREYQCLPRKSKIFAECDFRNGRYTQYHEREK